MSDLAAIEASWDKAARENATYNIITDPNYRYGWPMDEFFAHGQREIDGAMARLADLQVEVKRGRALDFGCGIGRLTQSLAMYFRRVDGVDVSLEMVQQARRFEPSPQKPRFHHYAQADLRLFKARTFDFVYSMIVLQHMPRTFQEGYVHEFFRVLKPGGIAMFNTPEGPDSGHPGWHLSMFGVTRETVGQWIADAGGVLVDVEDLGQDSGWRNLRYTATA